MNDDKKRILVVDDEAACTRLLKLNLEQTSRYIVQVEHSATAALTTAEHFHPDVVLMDVMMPELDGGELAQRFQAHPTLKHIPIVFLTAAARKSEVASHHRRIGGLPFLAKPVELEEVIDSIEEQLAGQGQGIA